MVPDKVIVAQLRRIDRTLSAVFLDPPGRWAILHSLQVDAPEQLAGQIGRRLQLEAASRGYVLDLAECEEAAWQSLQDAYVVCYVTEEDGSYRPLDGRVIEKLKRMDWYRRNLGIKDWRTMLQAKADILRERREKSEGDIWETIRRDKVFARCASDILWGIKPTRAVHVLRQGDGDEATQRGAAGDPSPDPGQGANGGGERGDPVAGEEHRPLAG